MTRRAVVVGGGWAGCAAAVELARAGWGVTLLEAARTLGGRARRIDVDGRRLDNGQHILLGAYTESLRLMALAGVDTGRAMLRLPLQMRYPPPHPADSPVSGGMDFVAPRLPAPLHLLAALLRSSGLAWEDKLSLARFSTTARWMGWQLHIDCSVNELLARFDQTPRLVRLMWRPLCLAALNTPPERASAQVFLNVLRDSLGARRKASDMLVPRADLSALFPEAAARYVAAHGGTVHAGAKAAPPARLPGGRWRVAATGSALGGGWHGDADAVIVATGAHAASALLRGMEDAGAAAALCAQLDAFVPEPITTCYLQYDAPLRLDLPFYALQDDAAARHWGQFVFDRGQLDAAQNGLLAVVISASGAASEAEGQQAALGGAVAAQLAAALGRPELARPSWTRIVTEKRATHACSPGLARPGNATALPGLLLAGDYTAGASAAHNYPATLESAVRSGSAAARIVLSGKWT